MTRSLGIALLLACLVGPAQAGAYRNFRTAIYLTVSGTRELADPKQREAQFERMTQQLRFDKVYIEVYRSGQFADDAALEDVKHFFAGKGIAVAGGIAYSAPEQSRQFRTLDYELAHDRDECRHAAELAARHFDEVILDDFFFYNTKSDADIAAKGRRSWTEYRLQRMREVAVDLVLKPARAVNPRVKVIIKYPNWYEHFQALGYDLDIEAKSFDGIYTGTETRDPEITDQLLQQYESYLVLRYFDHVRPGANRGGWVDTYAVRYVDRYAEQLWDTLFAKAPEITLFNWSDLATRTAEPGERPWSHERTSFDWDAMVRSGSGGGAAPGSQSASGAVKTTGWARVAGYSLEQADRILDKLGNPVGLASYKPFQSSGEDFLQDYLGTLGIPIELFSSFPEQASLVLLTQAASADPAILTRIKRQLVAGKSVVLTSGFVRALQQRGLADLIEIEATDRKISVHDFFGGYGSGRGESLREPGNSSRELLFSELRFYTNDSWPLIRGVAEARAVPLLLMNRYSHGVIYVLNLPDNVGDLYALPQPVIDALRGYLLADFPVRIDAPARVSLFAYDNGALVVESFRDSPAEVTAFVAGSHATLRDLATGETVRAEPAAAAAAAGPPNDRPRRAFHLRVPPHSYRVLASE